MLPGVCWLDIFLRARQGRVLVRPGLRNTRRARPGLSGRVPEPVRRPLAQLCVHSQFGFVCPSYRDQTYNHSRKHSSNQEYNQTYTCSLNSFAVFQLTPVVEVRRALIT